MKEIQFKSRVLSERMTKKRESEIAEHFDKICRVQLIYIRHLTYCLLLKHISGKQINF